jgi:Excreted virulence factor EspC, type VII ESX diderm
VTAGLEVHPPSLRRAGDSLAEVSGRLDAAWSAHAGQVAGMGDIAGDDPISSLIATSYRAACQIAERSYRSVATSFDGFGRALHLLADGYEQTDQANAAAISAFARGR